jgi:rhamnosyl/mannosyltransferase
MIYQLCEGLSKYGVESQVLSLSKDKSYTEKVANHKVNYAHLNLEYASTGMSLSAIPIFLKLAKKVDIIQYHFPWPFADVLHFLSFTKKPTVLTYHADIIKQKHLLKVYTPLMHAFLRSVDKIVCTSPNYLSSSEILQQYKQKTAVVPIGIPKLELDLTSTQNIAKIHYWNNLIGSKPFFLFVGVLRYYKGLHILLEAAKNAQYKIVIAGKGPLENDLKEKAQSLNLDNLIFLGEVSDEDKNILLHMCYAFVFPSHIRTEAFGISLLEAAMHGKAMISCEIGAGMSYINQHNQTGLIIPADSPSHLREAMDNLYNNPSLTKNLSTGALDRFNKLFKVEQMCDGYMDIYKKLI